MSGRNCISNRNIRIIAAYVESRVGDHSALFDGLSYPTKEYSSAASYFLNEDEWTTYETFETIFRRAKELVNEPHFFFNCGASCGYTGAWGRLGYFAKLFNSPQDGFHRLPFFNKTFNDTKEIRVVRPTFYDKKIKRLRVILQVRFHSHFDPNRDYIGDPFLRGIISSIPTLWGLPPATVRQPLNPYDPVRLFTDEPELAPYRLEPVVEQTTLKVRDPVSGHRVVAGKKVLLIPERINGQSIYMGRYTDLLSAVSGNSPDETTGWLITKTIATSTRILLRQGEIFSAPYSILDVRFHPLPILKRLLLPFKSNSQQRQAPQQILVDTIERLRKNVEAKHTAYRALEKTNAELRKAKQELSEYTATLEKRVEERTTELRRLTDSLQETLKAQLEELERHKELRRYLPPKIAQQILTNGSDFAHRLKRKLMTVVFSDIRGFSAITDSLEPEEIVELLNSYHSEMIQIIHHYGGTLNKIMGDGLVVFFGDPVDMQDHAQRAVDMAAQMQKKAHELDKQWRTYGHKLGIGIGINTGYMTVGNIGPADHKEYTVIGNQVNIAARLEQMAKPGQILITHRTLAYIKSDISPKFMGEIKVKGIHNPIKIYEISTF